MVYNPSTDFVGLWRAILGGVEKAQMPGLDFWVAAMGRAGLINVVFSQVAPTTNQSTTAWFRTATPSYAAEGALYLWDKVTGTYVPARPDLFLSFLLAVTNINNPSGGVFSQVWPTSGPPVDTLGGNGDWAIRIDTPGGIYGPKASGHWPVTPLPGTSYTQISNFLDWLGTTQGDLVYRGPTSWNVLVPGANGQLLHSGGTAANPFWASLGTSDLDAMFGGGVQGDIIYRDATHWTRLPANTAGYVLETSGAAANPFWNSASGILDANFGGGIGSILVRGASSWSGLAPGANGTMLTSNGTNPFWGPPNTGPAGPAGAQGIQGIQGPQGTPGTSPATIPPGGIGSFGISATGISSQVRNAAGTGYWPGTWVNYSTLALSEASVAGGGTIYLMLRTA